MRELELALGCTC